MARIIVTLVLVLVVALLVSMNIGSTAPVSLFGARFESVSVVTIAAAGFALGLLYSLFIQAGRYLKARKKRALASRGLKLEEREKALAGKEEAAAAPPAGSGGDGGA